MQSQNPKYRRIYDVIVRLSLFQTVSFNYFKDGVEVVLTCDYVKQNDIEKYLFHFSNGNRDSRQSQHKAIVYLSGNMPTDFTVGRISTILNYTGREMRFDDSGNVWGGHLIQYGELYHDIITGVKETFKHLLSVFFVGLDNRKKVRE